MKKDEKRISILKTASKVFSKYGFEKTTLDDIGNAAGLNKATLYYYFNSKEAIFSEIVMQEADSLILTLQKQVAKHRTAEKKILEYILERWACYEKAMNLHEVSMGIKNLIRNLFSALYQKIRERETEFLATIIQDGINSGEFSSTDAHAVSEIFITVSDGIKKEEYYKQLHENPDEPVDYAIIQTKSKAAIQLMINGMKNNK